VERQIVPLGFTRPVPWISHGSDHAFLAQRFSSVGRRGSFVGLFCDCERKLERALDGVRLIRTYEWGVVEGAVVVKWERRSVWEDLA